MIFRDDDSYPDERAMHFIQTHYWVKEGMNGETDWKFSRSPLPTEHGPKLWRRPNLEEVMAARWDGRTRVQVRFRRRWRTGGSYQDPACPVYRAHEAAQEYLKRKQDERDRP